MPPSPHEEDPLTELRITVARLDERMNTVISKLDQSMVSREHLQQTLGPLTENMNKWKGGVAALTVVAGSVGALVTTFVKSWILNGGSPP
jgi:hypothetical protein